MDQRQPPLSRRRNDSNDSNDSNGETAETPIYALAVDDDPGYIHLIEQLLSQSGFHPAIAGDGGECLEKMHAQDFDLVLIDLTMPGMSGLDTLAAVRSDDQIRHVYTMALTARDDLATKIAALNSGFDDFLAKSSTNEEMEAKLKSTHRLLAMQKRLRQQNNALYHLAITDALTGIGNRRFFFGKAEEIHAAGETSVTVILFDLNLFKAINDRYGHLAGDRILADVGGVFRNGTRERDVVARYGGDEFAMILTGESEAAASLVAQRLCDRVAALSWTADDGEFSITMSHGVASSVSQPGISVVDLIAICDEDLYRRKRAQHQSASGSSPGTTSERTGQ